MAMSHPLRRSLYILCLLLVSVSGVMAADPGLGFPFDSAVNDQKAGSILVYNLYASNPAAPTTTNARINMTNTADFGVTVHLFLIDGSTCLVVDRYICLSENQTMSFLMSEQDPGVTGYMIAVATDFEGIPIRHNFLIGDVFVKFVTGHFANLAAEAISALISPPAIISADGTVAFLVFNDVFYNRLPSVLAASNIPARADGNDTIIVINHILGDLRIRALGIGPVFGILYDDAEQPHSFNGAAGCQGLARLDNVFPRTTPRFEVVIPAGQTGWLKIWGTIPGTPILGAMINFNPNAAASAGRYNSGHNLHKLKLENRAVPVILIPVFPSVCPSTGGDRM